MSLLEVQNFTARIYTDENLRRKFLAAPEQTGRENNLSEKEIAELAAVFPEELNFFADSPSANACAKSKNFCRSPREP